MNGWTLGLIGWLGAVAPAAAFDACEHSAERNLDIDARAIDTLALSARAGELEIRGEPGLEQIVVRGRACASDAERLADIRLTERRDGATAVVAVEMPEQDGGWFGNAYQRLDLEIVVPARLALDVADTSGDAGIRGVNRATVKDSSGDLEIEDIAGQLLLTDSSGDIDVRGAGEVRVANDSSGDIDIADVSGSVAIDNDSSGDLIVRDVQGDARVDGDSSGDIRFADIGGSATVGNDSSGDIIADRIGRDFTVRNDGSGRIRHTDVQGQVSVPED